MSIARQFFREFRPLFRLLEEPLGRQPGFPGIVARNGFDDLFPGGPLQALQARPAVDVSEQNGIYLVEAELPGVKKEDVDVRIGDGGRSVTIEGRIVQNRVEKPSATSSESATDASAAAEPSSDSTTVAQKDQMPNQISVERAFTDSTTFTRTVWLSRPVDASKVSAKLSDGVLTLKIPRAEEPGSAKIDVE
ncbi:HSP20-like chaperone [Dentipellis sp. KUC8613]|nr:HSP20-like chaperone [Dentipellis sp. KUC8613]